MGITLIFLALVVGHLLITAFSFRNGFLVLLFIFPLYPRFLSVGVSSEGFALSGPRAMYYVLFGFFMLRWLWGSADIRRAIQIAYQYKRILIPIVVFLAARLVGNIVTNRIDLGSIAAMVNETLLSLFIVLMVLAIVRNRRDIITVMTVIGSSLLIVQFAATFEFFSGEPLIPASVDLQFETNKDADELLEGRTRDETYRAMGFFDNPLKLAGFMCLTIPMMISLIRVGPSLTSRGFAIISALLALPVSIFCGSRTAMGALVIMAGWYMYTNVARGMTRAGRRSMGIIALVVATTFLVGLGSGLIDAFLFSDAYGRSSEARLFQFVFVPLALVDSPIFGFGFSRNIVEDVEAVKSLDSLFLQMALEGGIVSLIALAVAILRTAKLLRTVKSSTLDPWYRSVATGLNISLAIGVLVGLVLSLSQIRAYMFIAIGLAIALHYFRTTESTEFIAEGRDARPPEPDRIVQPVTPKVTA